MKALSTGIFTNPILSALKENKATDENDVRLFLQVKNVMKLFFSYTILSIRPADKEFERSSMGVVN